jgi:broad specificity phosphatase PhoE
VSALRLYVLRHGEPTPPRTFYGHHDVELSARGRAQVQAQVRSLGSVRLAAIYSSDLQRARIGAEALALDHDLQLTLEPALREMHLGELEGIAYADALQRFPALAGRSYRDMLGFRMPGGGESVRDVAERVIPCVENIVRRHVSPTVEVRSPGPPGVVIYAHNTVVRVLLAEAAGVGVGGYGRFEQHFGALNRIDFRPPSDAGHVWQGATIGFCNVRVGE